MNSKAVALAFAALLLAGCESISDATHSVRDKFTREEPRTKTFSAQPRIVYEAVRSAAGQMGYHFVRGGPAQGEFDAVSAVGQGESHRSSRQVSMKARLQGTLDRAGTDVTVSFMEIIEADSTNRGGQATEQPLRDTPQYEVFFRRVEQALAAANVKD
ncbi:MAG TPA: hypothetical protein VM029_02890 [Opitutaceae bacterium]|nr:hypothetical protein [Opitutaceae bacterium]